MISTYINVETYLSEALALIRKNSFRNADLSAHNSALYPLDWKHWAEKLCHPHNKSSPRPSKVELLSEKEIDVWAKEWAGKLVRTRNIVSTADAHIVIANGVRTLDSHSSFHFPRPSNLSVETTQQKIALPYGHLVENDIGRFVLPSYSRPVMDWSKYISTSHDVLSKMKEHGISKWIIDLRGNSGGSLYPMVASVTPFINDPVAMYFFKPHITKPQDSCEFHALHIKDKGLVMNGWNIPKAVNPCDKIPPTQPVAVLTSMMTASAAEAVCISLSGLPNIKFFGQATCGMPTLVHDGSLLSDGALIGVTKGLMANRLQQCFAGPLRPDKNIFVKQAQKEDIVIKAALNWLCEP